VERHRVLAPAVATAALFVPLAQLDRRMQATGGPGIIAFELAGRERSQPILDRWGDEGRRAAFASLVLDFPFLVAYTLLNSRLSARAACVLSNCHLVSGARTGSTESTASTCSRADRRNLPASVASPHLEGGSRPAAPVHGAGPIRAMRWSWVAADVPPTVAD